ncbi:hypothetical protein RJ641_012075 [Dillenia turbinata]|uniref:Uncharacterized protein n=1 Tax=Dillenia turbinata TaxID=194707 RepID=A0AAN8V505_9MAGN
MGQIASGFLQPHSLLVKFDSSVPISYLEIRFGLKFENVGKGEEIAGLRVGAIEKVVNFEISFSNTAFSFLEEILVELKYVTLRGSKGCVSSEFEACLEILDLLYEKEVISLLYSSPCLLAGSVLI